MVRRVRESCLGGRCTRGRPTHTWSSDPRPSREARCVVRSTTHSTRSVAPAGKCARKYELCGQGADAAPGRSGSVTAPDRAARAWITPERWAQLEPLIDAALDLAPAQRATFCERVGSSHPELRADLERLVRRAEDDRDLFASAAAERFALLFDDEATRVPPADILPQLQASLGTA